MSFDLAWFETAAPRRMRAWCGVEAQHVVSTMRLVDTPAEQDLLEQLLEGSKPPVPPTALPKHYLLTTPFRYSPAHASRFRKPHARASGTAPKCFLPHVPRWPTGGTGSFWTARACSTRCC